MSQKDKWYAGWWLIPILLLLGVIAWKVYPLILSGEILKKVKK